jgi:hypothetical protein
MNLDEKIAKLNDQQVLSIVDSLAGEFATEGMPEGRNEQAGALASVLGSAGHPVDTQVLLSADTIAAAQAARELLKTMAGTPEMRASVEGWLDRPPIQEMAPIPLLLAAPVVLTGCIAFLTVVGSIRFSRDKDGNWAVTGDTTPLGKNIVAIAKILTRLGGGSG